MVGFGLLVIFEESASRVTNSGNDALERCKKNCGQDCKYYDSEIKCANMIENQYDPIIFYASPWILCSCHICDI